METGGTYIQFIFNVSALQACLQKPVFYSTRDFIHLNSGSVYTKTLHLLPARTSQSYADSLGAEIKNTVAGQIHPVRQSPEHIDIALVYH